MSILDQARQKLEAARNAQRNALATQAPEPASVAALYAPAVAALDALAAAPDAPPQVLQLLGVALMEAGHAGEAVAVLERAASRPDAGPGVLADLGNRYLALGRRDEAKACFERALGLDPSHAVARASRALLLLGAGDFARGWAEYEWRLRTGFDSAPRGDMPYAACADPAGRRVFVASEQGIGDEVMFASCMPDLLQAAGACTLECSARLLPLFARSFPRARVIARSRASWPSSAQAGEVECGLWAGSLPGRFRSARADFPGRPYLEAEPAAVARWRSQLAKLGVRRTIGLAWTGGLPETARAQRSLAFAELAPLFSLPDTAFVSLELYDRTTEAREVSSRGGAKLVHWPGVAADPDHLAALIAALDLVICVPNAAAHLAGALGKEVRVMVAGAPTWRYGWEGERVPWYGSMRVLRRAERETRGSWIRGIAADLAG